ncbi:hypothetical protein EC973_005932 [Apophysomyces ossiformis]|uniref:HbrB-domain-containing protein n=1 Tax=Apophysomyces ossiformis TaxID=679940 RepID=A0A8H7BWR0_9FUNG|nr:hypothetical protein EC973_005932 [Apophysomyces ossiformis]
MSSSSHSSASSNYFDRATPTSVTFPSTSPTSANAQDSQLPTPTRSVSASTPTMQNPPGGGGSQTKRHSMRSPPVRQASFGGQPSSISLDRTLSSHSTGTSQGTYTSPQRPTSPITSPSLHKSLNALDAKSITSNMERSNLHDVFMTSPSSPGATGNPAGFYFANPGNAVSTTSFQPMSVPPSAPYPYHRQGSMSSLTLSSMTSTAQNTQGDVWQTLCVCVLPLFNGEGVQGTIEDLNELLRRCLTDPISPQLYHDIEALLRDGMFTLNSKMLGVTDEKLLDRLVEQWSFFFTYALPYFEAVFLPLRTDVRYRSVEEAEMWNMRNLALRSFRDNVILLQTKRLEGRNKSTIGKAKLKSNIDVFTKLFTDFGSSQNPAATAAKMLQMTSILASSPDHNEELERILSNLKANWKMMMTKRERRGFAGVRKAKAGLSVESSRHIFGALS